MNQIRQKVFGERNPRKTSLLRITDLDNLLLPKLYH
nr:MAG TPA: hypothetical protein [Caudoviricetes sp.]